MVAGDRLGVDVALVLLGELVELPPGALPVGDRGLPVLDRATAGSRVREAGLVPLDHAVVIPLGVLEVALDELGK